MSKKHRNRTLLLIASIVFIIAASTRLQASQSGTCGGQMTTIPFDDVLPGNVFFCSIAEAFFAGLSNGTDATHYSPAANVPREQMAAFITRTMDQSLKRGSRRAALERWWRPLGADDLTVTQVQTSPQQVKSDGADLWVANGSAGTVSRVRASDGKLLETWTGASSPVGVLAAKGLIFITGGGLYKIDPTQPAGAVTFVTSLDTEPSGIAFDGARIWTANFIGTVSIVTLNPVSVSNVGGFSAPRGILYDGANIWVADFGDSALKKLDASGNIIGTVMVGSLPQFPCFDGTNIWVPNQGSSEVTVVRASTGNVLATLTGNGLNSPITAAFDGERILVTNFNGDSVSLWKATDLTPLGSVSTGAGTHPFGACSDGINFWITLNGFSKLVRF